VKTRTSEKGSKPQRCPHGCQLLGSVHESHIDAERLNDANDEQIMEFYSACDCCGYPMHESSPFYLNQQTGETLCGPCSGGMEP
jgi:hypothetical protein